VSFVLCYSNIINNNSEACVLFAAATAELAARDISIIMNARWYRSELSMPAATERCLHHYANAAFGANARRSVQINPLNVSSAQDKIIAPYDIFHPWVG